MGSIYKRGNIYWIQYYRNAKPYRKSTRSRKEVDAKHLPRKREGEISEGKLPRVYFDRVRFDELAEDLLADYRINQKKIFARAERSVNHLREFFGGMRVTLINTPKIRSYIDKRIFREVALPAIKIDASMILIFQVLGPHFNKGCFAMSPLGVDTQNKRF